MDEILNNFQALLDSVEAALEVADADVEANRLEDFREAGEAAMERGAWLGEVLIEVGELRSKFVTEMRDFS